MWSNVQICILEEDSAYDLSNSIENFVKGIGEKYEIVDIKYSTNAYMVGYTSKHEYSAMIIYK